MQDTSTIVHLQQNHGGKEIFTSLTEEIQTIIEEDGFKWFEALQGVIKLSDTAFAKVERLISPEPC